jgi:hypothetical protein
MSCKLKWRNSPYYVFQLCRHELQVHEQFYSIIVKYYLPFYDNSVIYVGLSVLTLVSINSIVFGNVTLCSLVDVFQCLGGKYCLHLYGRKLSQAKKHSWFPLLADYFLLVVYLVYTPNLKMEAGRSSEI